MDMTETGMTEQEAANHDAVKTGGTEAAADEAEQPEKTVEAAEAEHPAQAVLPLPQIDPPGERSTLLTREALQAMSEQEINRCWDEVREALGRL